MWKALAVGPRVSSHYSGCDKPEAGAQPVRQVQGSGERPGVGRESRLRHALWEIVSDFLSPAQGSGRPRSPSSVFNWP